MLGPWTYRAVSEAAGKPMTEAGATNDTAVNQIEFDQLFDDLKNWGQWGPDDEMGTLHHPQ